MKMKRFAAAFIATATLVSCLAGDLPQLKVSDNHRFLVTQKGEPFFWLGDTAWELFHRLNREEAELYLKNRAERRYTVIQAVVIAELDGLKTPNPYGHTPLEKNDPTKPNEDYFKHVDWIVAKANALGLYIGMLPTWGNQWHKTNAIFTAENAEIYGEWLGRRYKSCGFSAAIGTSKTTHTRRSFAQWLAGCAKAMAARI
jgi:hypothetical protein